MGPSLVFFLTDLFGGDKQSSKTLLGVTVQEFLRPFKYLLTGLEPLFDDRICAFADDIDGVLGGAHYHSHSLSG